MSTVQRPEQRLLSLAARMASGALEVREKKKRWVFFLEHGALVYTHSNLKGDSEEQLKIRYADADEERVHELQAASRLAGILRAAPDALTRWHAATDPPERLPLSLSRALFRAIRAALEDARVLALLEEGGLESPVSSSEDMGRLEPCGLTEEALSWVDELDGAQELEEVLAACPDGQTQGSRLLLLGMWLGVVASGTEGLGDNMAGEALDDEAVAVVRLAVARIAGAQTHFEVLGPDWDAPHDAFREAFFALARMLHPDRLGTLTEVLRVEAGQAFDRARQAWEVLSDASSRRAYTDHAIHGKKTEEEIASEEMEAIFAAETDFRRGLAAFHAGQIRAAFGAFDAAVRQDPGESEYKMYLGYTMFRTFRTSNLEKAEQGREMLMTVVDSMKERLSAAGDKPPHRLLDLSSRSWMLMGRVYRDQGEAASSEEVDGLRAAAKRCFLQALRVNPSNTEAQRELKRMKLERERASRGFWRGLFGKSKRR